MRKKQLHNKNTDLHFGSNLSDVKVNHMEGMKRQLLGVAEGWYLEAEGWYLEAEGWYLEAEGWYLEVCLDTTLE